MARIIIVDFRINETLQIGAVANSAYQTWGAKVWVSRYESRPTDFVGVTDFRLQKGE